MNLLSIAHFLAFVIYFGMICFLIHKDLKPLLNRVLIAFIGCFTLWSFVFIFFYQPNVNYNTATFLNNLASVGWISFAMFYLWFILVFTEKQVILKNPFVYTIFFALPAVFIYKQFTGALISNYIKKPWGWERIWSDSVWSYSFFLYYLCFVIMGLYFLNNFWRKTPEKLKRKQAQTIFYASLISLVGGTIIEILLPLLNMIKLPSIANIVNLILVGGMVYAVVKYRFITITPSTAAEQIISTMADSLALLDKEGNIISVNQALLSLSGYQKEELIGKPVELLLEKDNCQKFLIEGIVQKEIKKEIELNLKTKNGKLFPVLLSSSPIIDSKGEVAGVISILTEISEIKKTKELIEKSQQEALSLFKNSPIAGIYQEDNGTILNINTKFTELFGYTLEEIKGKNINEGMIFPDNNTILESDDLIKRSIAGEDVVFETIRKRKDGTLVPVVITVSAVLRNDEKRAIVAFYQDISKEKEYLEKIEGSEKKFRNIFENMPAGYYQTDKDGNIITVNPAGIKILGYQSLDEVIGKNVAQKFYYNPEDRSSFLEALKENKGELIDYEIVLKNSYGHPITVSTNSKYYYHESGETIGVEGIFADISERKKAEEALRKSQQEFSSLFQSHSEAVLYLDEKANILDANRRFTELFGYSLEEIKGKNVNCGIIHPPDKIEEGKELDKEVFFKSYSGFETVRKKKDGTLFPVFTSGSPVLIDGEVKGIIATYIDITERKKAEEALRKSQQEFSSLFQSYSEAVLYLDKEANILDANKRFSELFGYSLEEIKGKFVDCGIIHPPDKIEEGKELDKKVRSREGYSQFETIRKKKDGTLFPVSISSSPVLINGEVAGIISIYIDITERKKAEEALRKSQQEFSSLFHSHSEALLYLDNEGTVLNANKRFAELFGYPLEEIKGKNINYGSIVPPDRIKEGEELDKRAVSQEFFQFETIRQKKGGVLIPVSISSSPVVIDGEVKGIITSYIDITERKKMEEQLQKMARIDNLTGCFNRGYGLELLERQMNLAKRNKSPLLIAFLDINHLKQINDQYGHQEGDIAIKMVGNLLKCTLREVDIICRMGGDEFLLAFPDSSIQQASLIKQRLEEELFSLNKSIKKGYQIKFSIGFSEYLPSESKTSDELIMIADQRMYEEKEKNN